MELLVDGAQWESSRHRAAGLGCTGCHGAHRPAARPLLTGSLPGLCLDCHREIKKHDQLALADSVVMDNCTACHDPHGGKDTLPSRQAKPWEFNRRYVHWPVAQGMCESCHDPHLPGAGSEGPGKESEPEKTGSKGLLVKPSEEICFACHGEKRDSIMLTAHWNKLVTRSANPCLVCHSPHSSDYEHLTVYESNRLCLDCHTNKTPHHFLAVKLDARNKLKCVDCHDPHGNGNKAFLKYGPGDLCQQCHKI